MDSIVVPSRSRSTTQVELLTFLIAYVDLLVASWEAREQGGRVRDNPVTYAALHRKGIRGDVLLWMYYQGHIEHLRLGPDLAASPVTDSVLLTQASAFALTPFGEAFAGTFVVQALLPESDAEFEDAWALMRVGALVPGYRPEGRVFTWGRHVLKSFRQPSLNQELILQSAEELGWPGWFDDPLPRGGPGNPKVRLHDTIKDLNRRQQVSLVRFKGDGTGTRVGWELR